MKFDSVKKKALFVDLVQRTMQFKLNQWHTDMDKLIEDNSAKTGQFSRQVYIRGTQFLHSKETTASSHVNGRVIPKTSMSLHFDLFEEGNRLYMDWTKFEHDRKFMTQCLVLLTAGLKEWQDIRECLPHQCDAYLSDEYKTPRKKEDIYWNVDPEHPHVRLQIDDYITRFAIYGLSDIMGL